MANRLLAVALVPYVAWLVFAYEYHFIDGVNLAFHEAGHLFLSFFGPWIHVLGGTLAQLFFPAACAGHFWVRGRPVETAVCTVWFAESLMYTARYLADAKDQALPLVGGHIHDWGWMLSRLRLIDECRLIGALLHGLASLLAIAAVGWAVSRAFAPEPAVREARP